MEQQSVIVRFQMLKKRKIVDIEVPLEITAQELIIGLNEAYDLGIDESNLVKSYLVCEQPIALIRGRNTLRSLGVRDGAILKYTQ